MTKARKMKSKTVSCKSLPLREYKELVKLRRDQNKPLRNIGCKRKTRKTKVVKLVFSQEAVAQLKILGKVYETKTIVATIKAVLGHYSVF